MNELLNTGFTSVTGVRFTALLSGNYKYQLPTTSNPNDTFPRFSSGGLRLACGG